MLAELLCLTARNTQFGQIFLQLRVFAEIVSGRTAHIVRHEERQALAHSFAPRCGIIQIQTFGFVLRVTLFHQVGVSAAHRFVGVFLIGEDTGAAYAHSYGKRCKENCRGYREVLPLLRLGGYCQFAEEQDTDHHTNVIRHLRVTEESYRHEEHNQQRAYPILLSVRQVESYHHRYHPRDGYRLAAVLRRNDHKEVRRHRYRKRTGYTQPLIHAERTQQRKERQQVEEEHKERYLRSQDRYRVHRTHDGRRQCLAAAYLVVRHTGEHRSRPERIASLLRIRLALLYSSHRVDTVAGIDNLALQRWPEIDCRRYGKQQHYTCVGGYGFPIDLFHYFTLMNGTAPFPPMYSGNLPSHFSIASWRTSNSFRLAATVRL